MASLSRQNHLRRAAQILKLGEIAAVPCDRCHFLETVCTVMSTLSGESKCAECTRRGRPCVRTSWAALDESRDKLSNEIVEDEKKREELIAQLAQVQARIDRNRLVRAQAEKRSKEKMECLMREMEESGDPPWLEDIAHVDFGLEGLGVASPFVWNLGEDVQMPS